MKPIIIDLKSKKEIEKLLIKLIKSAKKGKLLYDFGNDEECINLKFCFKKSGKIISYSPISASLVNPYDNSKVMFTENDSDAAFFEAACSEVSTLIKLVELYVQVITYNTNYGKYRVLFKNSIEPFGLTLGAALIRNSKNYCRLFGNFLKTIDMNHEVNETFVIHEAFKLYGCCQETMSLWAIRLFSACGQFGVDEFEEIVENYEINEFLNLKENFDFFLEEVKRELYCIGNKTRDMYSTLHLQTAYCENNPESNISQIFKILSSEYSAVL